MSWGRRRFVVSVGAGMLALRPRAGLAGSERQAAVIARALTYERTLETRVGSALVVAVVYAEGRSSSSTDAQRWLEAFAAISDIKVFGRGIATLPVNWGPGAASVLESGGTDVVLVCEGLESQATQLRAFTADQRLLSVGSVRSYLDDTCTLGVFEQGGKLRITVNLTVAEREHVKFSSRLLKIADIIR